MSRKGEFTQINMQHSKVATSLLSRDMSGCMTKQNIYLIQEPWVRQGQIMGLGNRQYDLFYNRAGERPRAAVALNKSLKGFMLETITDDDITAVQVNLKIGNRLTDVVVASGYMPYENDVVTPGLSKVINYCKTRHLDLILGCDANAHNECWGSTDTNRRGDTLLQYLAGTDLYLLNRGNAPTFVTSERQEVIDITLCSNTIRQHIHKWRVADEESSSDHRYIKFELVDDVESTEQIVRRNPRKTNWDAFRSNLERRTKKIKRIPTVQNLEEEAKKLETDLIAAFEENCRPSVQRNESPPWWNLDLQKKRKKARQALRRALSTNQDEDWTVYKNLQRDLKSQIWVNKKRSFRKFCEDLSELSEMSKLKKILTKTDLGKVGTLKDGDGKNSECPSESLRILMDCHFPDNKALEDAKPISNQHSTSKESWNLAKRVVSLERLNWALSCFDGFKAPGPDKIVPAFLKESPDITRKNLRDVLRASLAFGYIPESWRQVRAVFLPKPGKKDYTEPKSFRPISLTSFILKALERLIESYIKETTLQERPLHPRQHAYTKGRSTETALHDLTSRVEESIRNGNSALVGFLDIEGAFDNAPFGRIKEATEKLGVDGTIVNWIDNMLRQRTIQSELGRDTVKVTATRGCPQGGVLSPLLWNITVNSLLTKLDDKNHYAQAYADDVAIIYSGKDTSTLCSRMQRGLDIIQEWCMENQLTVNPKKTELVLFTRKRKLGEYILPNMNGTQLQLTKEVKYLGVILDSKLCYGRHVEEQCAKAKRIMWALRGAFGKTWGLKPKQTLWLYTSIVRPILLYACVIWWERAQTKVGIRLLRSVQRLALMGATGAMSTTSTNSLEALCAMTPLPVEIKCSAGAAALRMIRNRAWNTKAKVGHCRIVDEWTKMPELGMPQDSIGTVKVKRNFKVTFPRRTEWEQNGLIGTPEDALTLYTDGSVTPGGTGAGVYVPCTNTRTSYPLGKNVTIFQAEMYALMKAAEALNRDGITQREIRLFSDSQASLKALNAYATDSGLVAECAKEIEKLATNNSVELCWVPGHRDIIGNEVADELAKEGAEATPIGPEPILPISKSLLTRRIKEAGLAEHKYIWRNVTDSKLTKKYLAEPNRGTAKYLMCLSRDKLKPIVEVMTGHCRLNKHLKVLGVNDNPICPMCLESEETAEHFIAECPALAGSRLSVFGEAFPSTDSLSWADPKRISRFIQKTGRFSTEY